MFIQIEDVTIHSIDEPREQAITRLQKATLEAITQMAESKSRVTLGFIAAALDTNRACIASRIKHLETAGWISIT